MDKPLKSLFEIEADRLRELNKAKKSQKDLWKFKTIGYGLGIFIALLFLIPATVYGVLVHGFVAMKLWQWFVVPILHFPSLGLVQSIGIGLVIRIFTYQFGNGSKIEGETTKEKVLSFIGLLLIPWYILFIGYVVHLFL